MGINNHLAAWSTEAPTQSSIWAALDTAREHALSIVLAAGVALGVATGTQAQEVSNGPEDPIYGEIEKSGICDTGSTFADSQCNTGHEAVMQRDGWRVPPMLENMQWEEYVQLWGCYGDVTLNALQGFIDYTESGSEYVKFPYTAIWTALLLFNDPNGTSLLLKWGQGAMEPLWDAFEKYYWDQCQQLA